ncbi:copper homeostasis periplasmic binding protein CopC [Mesorhizobium sp. LMG 17147]|uniref:copper homeostasis periplasmic binding protein CopC n=1 Tax=Mesorhizobium sp. LMG 17147 TaxID=2963091 RepID=UPI0020C9F900|nr:copper homeostasis periplasmic binding protein CopC [Mesorhizobium sp. LMG 17147]MCP9234140.1 copper homeostasis periplasmic binding protein CopC [Mesorhizobium sp. LMG 17147]
MRTIRLIAALAPLGLPISGQALAHARLLQATPEYDSTIATPPTEIRLRFSEAIEVRFSGIDLSGPDGAKITTGEIAVRDKVMVIPVSGSLAPGVYQVEWHVLSADGHKVKGNFKFEVRP